MNSHDTQSNTGLQWQTTGHITTGKLFINKMLFTVCKQYILTQTAQKDDGHQRFFTMPPPNTHSVQMFSSFPLLLSPSSYLLHFPTINFISSHLYQKDERALPGNIHSSKLFVSSYNKRTSMYLNAPQCTPMYLNLLKPTGHVMHQQFNTQQLYVLPTLYLCVLYLSENKQRLVRLTA